MPRTRYVKTPEQLAEFSRAYSNPIFAKSRGLSITFETDPEIVRELLPLPLEPAEKPLATVGVSRCGQSNCVGVFDGGSINLACTFNGEPGLYCVTMPMSTDTAIMFGRELFAEPKKQAQVQLLESENEVRGTITRHSITYIELVGSFDSPLEPSGTSGTAYHYYFKYLPAANGIGLAADPELIRVTHQRQSHEMRQGTGQIIFRESQHDPVIDIPVLSTGPAVFSLGETSTSAEVVATVPAEQFLPYAHAKTDDLTLWLREREAVTAGS